MEKDKGVRGNDWEDGGEWTIFYFCISERLLRGGLEVVERGQELVNSSVQSSGDRGPNDVKARSHVPCAPGPCTRTQPRPRFSSTYQGYKFTQSYTETGSWTSR
jgi:hypothetical protein